MILWSILAALLAITLVFLVAKSFSRWGRDDDAPDGVTASHAGGMLSALFLLIFAIAVIIPWTVSDSARQNTHAEAQSLVEAYWAAGDLPEAEKDHVRAAIRDYTQFVIDEEWSYMVAHDDVSPEGWKRMDALRSTVGDYTFTGKQQKDALNDLEDDIEGVYAARRQRASDAGSGLPSGVLVMTLLTGAIMIVYPILAGARPRGRAWVPLLLMAGILGVSVYLVFNINHAFSGALEVGSGAFKTAQQEYARIP
ncbi:hypothetical protein [Actinocorallia longicatena]|uniref:DUF4239 domain-containing protein n=1 Tax=Actinocorallia longicatena TaxID=111803 RepID=A0ABP6QLY9_9ACTN